MAQPVNFNELNLLSESTFIEKMDQALIAFAAIANGRTVQAQQVIPEIRSWRTVQSLVRLGFAAQFFHVGDQLECYHERFGQGSYPHPLYPDDPTKTVHKLIWDVIGIDYDIPCNRDGTPKTIVDVDGKVIPAHSLTLQLHDSFAFKNVANNGGMKWNRSAYNNWEHSDIRTWLNTRETISGYYPNETSYPGFLDGLDPDLLAVLGPVLKTTARNSAGGGDGGRAIRLVEDIFIPSVTEVYAGANNQYNEGAILQTADTVAINGKFYCSLDTATGVITKLNLAEGADIPANTYEVKAEYEFYGKDRSDLGTQSGTGADKNRRKSIYPTPNTSYKIWWTRSPITGSSDIVRYVGADGSIYNNYATSSYGIAPACCII